MDINKLVDKLNAELDKLNKMNNSTVDTNSFFTSNEKFNDDISLDELNKENESENKTDIDKDEFYEEEFKGEFEVDIDKYKDIEPDDETKDLVSIKERRLIAAQNMFKKSIRISLKSFLISLSLSFLNLFI